MRLALSAVLVASSLALGSAGIPAFGAGESPEQARVRLNALYAKAAAAGRQFDDAASDAAAADEALKRERAAARRAEVDLARQSSAVAVLTVQQLQMQSGQAPILTLIGQKDPRELLALSSAYESTAQAMTARIEELSARQAVHRVTQRRLERAREQRRAAVASAARARAAINAAIAESKRATLAADAERTRLLNERPRVPAMSEPDTPPSPGTRPAPDPAPEEPADGLAESDVSPGDDSVWDRIALCESGGNWHINTGNGYYGGLQFSARTWHGIGGPGLPHEHSREIQIHYAKLLQARYGWGQWSCAGARFI